MFIVEVYKSFGVRPKRFADGRAFAVANSFVVAEEEKGEPLSRDRVRREPDWRLITGRGLISQVIFRKIG